MKQEAMSPIISPRSPDATTDLKEAKSPEFTRNLKEATSPNSTPIFGAEWFRGFSSTSNAPGNNVMPHAPQPPHDPFWDNFRNTFKIPHVVRTPIGKTPDWENPNWPTPETGEKTLPLSTQRSDDAGHDPPKKRKANQVENKFTSFFFIVVLLILASL